ncbi:MAG: type IV pili methyl-accepting chemotaxis transducer N-terminal domain-containing protein [Pirellulales bacterium]|nr:type IV pili methyl-accepting chemotaxis transducer N-terminal domain-containing protein [Pirellulales bacterium]
MIVDSISSNLRAQALDKDDLVRRVSRRYLAVLAAILALVLADQAILQPLLARMNAFAPAINVAGRQRMLSQKIAKAALAQVMALDHRSQADLRAELRDAVAEWKAAHLALQHGDARRGIARLASPQIDHVWAEIEPHFDAMQTAATTLGSAAGASPEDSARAIDAVVTHEPVFLQLMDSQVSLFESLAGAELRRLRWCAAAVAAAIVALVIALGRLVIHPATQAIRGQVDELEQQVALRTRNLDNTLTALRVEAAERQAVEDRNRTLAAQLAHANRVETVGHLAAGLAHELNQPFAAIVNYTEACDLALERPLDEPARARLRELIERVRQASLRAGGIVRRMRDFVRPGAPSRTSVELIALLHEVVELCRPEAERGETSLSFVPPAGGELVVEVDAVQIQQVLVNLIQNSLHALAGNSPENRRIVLRIKPQPDSVQVDVVDNGPGLAGIDPNVLFAAFQTTKSDGLGIGLSICRSIVEQHQGTIWAQSLAPCGAQFSFVLPRIGQHAAEQRRQADRVCG